MIKNVEVRCKKLKGIKVYIINYDQYLHVENLLGLLMKVLLVDLKSNN